MKPTPNPRTLAFHPRLFAPAPRLSAFAVRVQPPISASIRAIPRLSALICAKNQIGLVLLLDLCRADCHHEHNYAAASPPETSLFSTLGIVIL
jgi:hypothetical protein